MKRLDALFYPQIVCLDEIMLKYLVLNFDRVYFLPNDTFLNPGHDSMVSRFSVRDTLLFMAFGSSDDVRYSAMYATEPTAWDERLKSLMDTYEWLEEKGICIPLKDERFEAPNYVHPMKAAVDVDMAEADFLALCNRFRNPTYLLPPDIPGDMKGGGMAIRPFEYKGDLGFSAICSERINSTLYIADRHDLVPVSNHTLFDELFALKLKRTVGNPTFATAKGLRSPTHKFKLQVLSWQLFVEVIPKEAIEAKSVKKIAAYKNESRELQKRYRNYVSMVETGITSEPWDEALPDEVDKLVRGKVIPEIEKLEDERKVLWEKFFGEAIMTSLQKRYLLPLVGMTLIPWVSYTELLWYSTVGAAAGATAWAGDMAPKLVELIQERRRLKRSALFFLLNLR